MANAREAERMLAEAAEGVEVGTPDPGPATGPSAGPDTGATPGAVGSALGLVGPALGVEEPGVEGAVGLEAEEGPGKGVATGTGTGTGGGAGGGGQYWNDTDCAYLRTGSVLLVSVLP